MRRARLVRWKRQQQPILAVPKLTLCSGLRSSRWAGPRKLSLNSQPQLSCAPISRRLASISPTRNSAPETWTLRSGTCGRWYQPILTILCRSAAWRKRWKPRRRALDRRPGSRRIHRKLVHLDIAVQAHLSLVPCRKFRPRSEECPPESRAAVAAIDKEVARPRQLAARHLRRESRRFRRGRERKCVQLARQPIVQQLRIQKALNRIIRPPHRPLRLYKRTRTNHRRPLPVRCPL